MGSTSLALDFLTLSSQLQDKHGAPTLFYGAVLAGLEETAAERGRCRIVVRVGQELCHFGKSAHGGALGETSVQQVVTPVPCAGSFIAMSTWVPAKSLGAMPTHPHHTPALLHLRGLLPEPPTPLQPR